MVTHVIHHTWASKIPILGFRGGNTVHKEILEFVLYYIRFDLQGGDFPPLCPRMLSTVFSHISVDLPCPRLPEGPTAHAEEDTRRFHEEQVGDKFKLTKFAKRFFPPASRDLTDKSEIEQWIKKGEYIQGELEALYMLRKYRTMKNRYYDKD